MQRYGLDQDHLIWAQEASKRKSYLCPECKLPLRLQKKPHKLPYFSHISSPRPSCRLAQKGTAHLILQETLANLLCEEGAKMEHLFPQIDQIADLACLKTRYPKVIEIQCSPLSLAEAKKRCEGYWSLDLIPIWILHDEQFNQRIISQAERFLRRYTLCYFTNFNILGEGLIYDQFEDLRSFYRHVKNSFIPKDLHSGPYPVDLRFCYPLRRKQILLLTLAGIKKVSFYIQGDLIDLFLKGVWKPSPILLFASFVIKLKTIYLFFFERLLRKGAKP